MNKVLKSRVLELTEQVESLREQLEEAQRAPLRRRLPDTRDSVTHKFSIDGHEGYLTVGFFDDGKPGELFIRMAKEGSTLGGLVDTLGIVTSLALQYGVPVEDLARKLQHTRFEPSGFTKNPELGQASSLADYIYRWIGMRFSESYREERARAGDSAYEFERVRATG